MGSKLDSAMAAEQPIDDAIDVVFVAGDLTARARQLADWQLAHPHHRALLAFWHDLDRHLLRAQLPGMSARAELGAARLVDQLLAAPLLSRLDDDMARAVRAFSDVVAQDALDVQARPGAGGLSHRLACAHVLPDALSVLTGLPLGQKAPAGPLGCSSLVALPELCAGGELIFGRNFDLLPHAITTPPLVVVHRPDRGLAHVSLHHGAGFTPGITAVNEAGLCVAVHQNFTRAVSPRGEPVVSVARRIIEGCRSLPAAVEKLRATRTAGGWTFVLGDAHRGTACAVETDIEGSASLFPPRDFLAVANCYRTRKKVHDFAFTGAWREHNWSRLSLLNRAARRGRGRFDVAQMAGALGDHTDAYDHDRRRALGNTVSAIHNVDAAIMAPGLDALYVATGPAPRNSSDGFVGFSLSALLAGRVVRRPSLPGPDDTDYRDALRTYARACHQLMTHDNDDEAQALLEQASALAPDEPIFGFMRAALCLRAGAAEEAAERFGAAVEQETSPYRRGLGRLLEGRALDVLGHRGGARRCYDDVGPQAEDVDPGLLRRARRDRDRGFSPRQAGWLIVDTLLADIPS